MPSGAFVQASQVIAYTFSTTGTNSPGNPGATARFRYVYSPGQVVLTQADLFDGEVDFTSNGVALLSLDITNAAEVTFGDKPLLGEDIEIIALDVPGIANILNASDGSVAAVGVTGGIFGAAPFGGGPFDGFWTKSRIEVPGDYDVDGDVDAEDYVEWKSQFGEEKPLAKQGADGNGDGVVNTADYAVWRENLRRRSAAPL